MAEGWTRALKGNRLEAYSAGLDPQGLNPRAVQVMAESGIDITSQKSRHLSEFSDMTFDYVVTVCAHVRESCPAFPSGHGTTVVHHGFDDPPRLAEHAADEEEALAHYRRVRDEIRTFIKTLPGALKATGDG